MAMAQFRSRHTPDMRTQTLTIEGAVGSDVLTPACELKFKNYDRDVQFTTGLAQIAVYDAYGDVEHTGYGDVHVNAYSNGQPAAEPNLVATHTGRVGVGTRDPISTLHVAGTARVDHDLIARRALVEQVRFADGSTIGSARVAGPTRTIVPVIMSGVLVDGSWVEVSRASSRYADATGLALARVVVAASAIGGSAAAIDARAVDLETGDVLGSTRGLGDGSAFDLDLTWPSSTTATATVSVQAKADETTTAATVSLNSVVYDPLE